VSAVELPLACQLHVRSGFAQVQGLLSSCYAVTSSASGLELTVTLRPHSLSEIFLLGIPPCDSIECIGTIILSSPSTVAPVIVQTPRPDVWAEQIHQTCAHTPDKFIACVTIYRCLDIKYGVRCLCDLANSILSQRAGNVCTSPAWCCFVM
jgi:hypothetical protein